MTAIIIIIIIIGVRLVWAQIRDLLWVWCSAGVCKCGVQVCVCTCIVCNQCGCVCVRVLRRTASVSSA